MKLMVRVLEEADLTRPQQAILLAMAESANDDGTSCYPSIDRIAWRAGYKPRNVVDIVRELRTMGVIEVVAESTAQRPTEYAIHLDQSPQKMSFEEWQQINGRYAERPKRTIQTRETAPLTNELTREIAPVQNDEGCNFTGQGVQFHERGVQSHGLNAELTREIAPDPVHRPINDPVGPSPETREASKRKRATAVPDSFQVTEQLIAWGETEGFPVAVMVGQVPQFIDYWQSKGETRKDWEATFRTWMRNARDWGRLSPRQPTERGSPPLPNRRRGGLTPEEIAQRAKELKAQGR